MAVPSYQAAKRERQMAKKFHGKAQGMKMGGVVEAKATPGGNADTRKKMKRGGFVPFKKKPAQPTKPGDEMETRAKRAKEFETKNGEQEF